ncbi:MAG: SelL-related redox protein, partial [Bacteroidota bacterium]
WQNTERPAVSPFPQILQEFYDQEEQSLSDLNQQQALVLVFLRHFGCTFCRESLENFQKKKEAFTKKNLKLVFVHMAEEAQAQPYFERYQLEKESRVSDPSCDLYRAFSLGRARFGQVFGLKSWWRGFWVGVVQGKGVGKLVGDGFRMPGYFIIFKDEIIFSQIPKKAADRPDYEQLAACEIG